MINSVRNTVLSILNKNNYGYISPSDFNLYAKQAQLEIFDEYISLSNATINKENLRQSGTEYANAGKKKMEDMEAFSSTNFLSQQLNNVFYAPSLVTTGDDYYLINKVLVYKEVLATGTNTSVVASSLVDSGATFSNDGISVGDIVVNLTTGLTAYVSSVSSNTTITLTANIFLATAKSYQILSASSFIEAEKVSHSKISLLRNSNLTNPSLYYPVYTLQGGSITVYPSTINTVGNVQAQYFRYPRDPKWTYSTLSGGEPAFNASQSDYQDFELPLEEEYNLVAKILQYCGMSIREIEVYKFAKQAEMEQAAK